MTQLCLQDLPGDGQISEPGFNLWMVTLAITNGVSICQSFMGRPGAHNPSDPTLDFGPIVNGVVGTIFSLMNHYENKWTQVKWSKPTAIFGFGLGETEMPPDMTINRERLYARFGKGLQTMRDRWQAVLTPDVFSKLTEVAQIRADRFDFPTELWAKILFDYAIAFQREGEKTDPLLDSLQPLYYGRVLSYVNKVGILSTQQAEEYVEEQCLVFEETKPYLIRRWEGG
jgi:hypothetical protein